MRSVESPRTPRLLLHHTPGLVGLVGGHLFSDASGVIAKILLIDHALLVDKKCHDTAGAIVRGKGDEAESTCGWKHAVVVTVIGHALARGVIALLGCLGNHWACRTFGLAFLDFPVEPVLFPWF